MPQPVPAVPHIPAGWSPVQADFGLWVTDSFSFLSQAPVLRAQLQSAQSLTGNALNIVHFGATAGDILEDPYGGWSTTATGSQPAWSWKCPAGCGGWYEVTITAFSGNQGSTAAQLVAALDLNGTLWQYGGDVWAVSGGNTGASGAVQVPMLPGDYVQALILPANTVSTPTTAGQLPTMELTWVSS